ncbi:hypothetical protein [Methyloglobulus sp.]|uniref:hypothetical protein n=1 Tax=Methyloglobulus sp. TaxID=2518622 RepID=UPI00398A10B1
MWKMLYDQLKSPERYEDYREATIQAIDFSKSWDIESNIPMETWWNDIDADGSISEKMISGNKTEKQKIPDWLKLPSGKTWETRLFGSPLLRYAIHIPGFYSDKPEFFATDMETKHIFYGQLRNTEILIVSFMDKATGGDMKKWVEIIMATTGFPVLELSGKDENTQPHLQEWIYEGSLPELAVRLELDEAHAYSGFAIMPPTNQNESALGARIYILLARRDSFA